MKPFADNLIVDILLGYLELSMQEGRGPTMLKLSMCGAVNDLYFYLSTI